MQINPEADFDTVYLSAVVIPGIRMIRENGEREQYLLYDVWCSRYSVSGKAGVTAAVRIPALSRWLWLTVILIFAPVIFRSSCLLIDTLPWAYG